MKRLAFILIALFAVVSATRCAEPATELQARVALALASAGTTPTVAPVAPVTPPVDLSMYEWKQLDDEQAALLCHGKLAGTLWFESGKYYDYNRSNWSKTATEPPITRARKVTRPAGAVCKGGCGPACGCSGTRPSATPASCPCASEHRIYPPISSAITYTSPANCST
jgi:hypothetical protein